MDNIEKAIEVERINRKDSIKVYKKVRLKINSKIVYEKSVDIFLYQHFFMHYLND